VFQLDDVTEDLDAELENTRKLLGLSIEEFDALDDMTNTIDDRFSVFDMCNNLVLYNVQIVYPTHMFPFIFYAF
jgi:hypothetical protein